MEYLRNNNYENTLLVCNKSECHRSYIELLFESKKRTGGDEIAELHYDNLLKQFTIVYNNSETAKNVLEFGQINFNNEIYTPKQIDKSKLILENVDHRLEKDIIELYADNLLQDIEDCEFSIEILKPGYVMLICNREFDIDQIKKRHSKHNKLQKKEITLHLVAKLDRSFDVSFKSSEYFNFYLEILNNTNKNNVNNSISSISVRNIQLETPSSPTKDHNNMSSLTVVEETNDETENLPIFSTSNTNSPNKTPIQESTDQILTFSNNEFILQEKIRTLEKKLRVYEQLNENLNRINKLSECAMRINTSCLNEQDRSNQSLFNKNLLDKATNDLGKLSISSSPNNQPSSRINTENEFSSSSATRLSNRFFFSTNQFKKDEFNNNITANTPNLIVPIRPSNKILSPENNQSENGNNAFRVRDNIQKFLIEEHKRFEQANPNSEDSESLNNIVPCKMQKPSKVFFNSNNKNRMNQVSSSMPSNTSFSNSSSSTLSFSPQATITTPLLRAYSQLNTTMINRFPIIKYQKPKLLNNHQTNQDMKSELDTGENSKIDDSISVNTRCSICLDDLVENDDVRILSCFHQFHVKCIDTWLAQKSNCPTCKFNLFNTLNDQS